MAPDRDYYADLELPPTADIAEIRRQFRKLALKYHPDRNPGREEEVNSKFQTIQAAHEILSNPDQKAKYDSTSRRGGRFPGPSGVRGNPWDHVSQQFPTPPRRNATRGGAGGGAGGGGAASGGAQRWKDRFSAGVPPTARQHTAAASEAKKNADRARASEHMRRNQSQANAHQESHPSQPPPPPPRTEGAKQRAQASFGARKPGFHPRSATGDEPPVANFNYSSRRVDAEGARATPPPPPPRQNTPPIPDPLSSFRDNGDSRQSTPYASHGGEKTNPFDGVPSGGRAKSMRDAQRNEGASSSEEKASAAGKPRSFSVPKQPNFDMPKYFDQGKANPFASQNTFTGAHGSSNHQNQAPGKEAKHSASHGPPMYGAPRPDSFFCNAPCNVPYFGQSKSTGHLNYPNGGSRAAVSPLDPSGMRNGGEGFFCSPDPSGIYAKKMDRSYPQPPSGPSPTFGLSSFEKRQRMVLDDLIRNVKFCEPQRKRACHSPPRSSKRDKRDMVAANETHPNSFTFGMNGNDVGPESAKTTSARMSKPSFEEINTQFSNKEQDFKTWQFNAGSDSGPQSGTDSRRGSPGKQPFKPQPEPAQPEKEARTPASGFDANGWNDKFGPQTFVPQPTSSASPTRSSRANSKKVRARPTVGTAAVVDDNSDDETYEWRGRNPQNKSAAADVPQAMDIDSSPPASAAHAQSASPRKIPVEPSRPEWRPGNASSWNPDGKTEGPEKGPVNNVTGSEDTDEFLASMADLKKVPPFVQQNSGLSSLSDLNASLPFESKASTRIKPLKVHPLGFPTPPEAPSLPPSIALGGPKPDTASWMKYLDEFGNYLRQWDIFNNRVIDHFTTRKTRVEAFRQERGVAFLGTLGDAEVQEYRNWVSQDNDIRRRWTNACEIHEQKLNELMSFREMMK